jgi:autotransporter-associated beta strand protein
MKLNQRGEVSGRRSSAVVLGAIVMMAASLLLLLGGPAQAQTNSFTNINHGAWSSISGVWLSNSSPYGAEFNPPNAAWPLAGSNTWVIVYTNPVPEYSNVDDPNNVYSFTLNQLIFGPTSAGVTNLYAGSPNHGAGLSGFIFNNNGSQPPAIIQDSTSLVYITVPIIGINSAAITNFVIGGTNVGTVVLAGNTWNGNPVDAITDTAQSLGTNGPIQVIKNGPFNLIIAGTASYQGGTIINTGMVTFTSSANVPTVGLITINNDTLLYVSNSLPSAYLAYLQSSTNGSVGSIVIDAASANASINLASGGSAGSGLTNIGVVAASSMTFGGTIASPGNYYSFGALPGITLTITNVLPDLSGPTVLDIGPSAGTVDLSVGNNNNGYSGGTDIRGGILAIAADNNLGSGSVTMTNGGTLRVTTSFATSRNFVMQGPLGGGFDVIANALNINGQISGGGGFVMPGSGTLTLTAANPVGGAVAINGTTLVLDGTALSNAVVAVNLDNGLLFSNETQVALGGISGSNLVTWSSSGRPGGNTIRLQLGNDNNTPGEFEGQLPNIPITKIGNNVQILSVGAGTNNTFSTTPVLSSGVLGFGTLNALGGSAITVPVGAGLAAAYPIDNTFLSTAIAGGSLGVAALARDSQNNLNLSLLPAGMSLGAAYSNTLGLATNVISGTTTTAPSYGGLLSPNANNTYVLGGGGGTLILASAGALSGANKLVIEQNGFVGGAVQIDSPTNTYTGDTIISNGAVLILSTWNNLPPAQSFNTGLSTGKVIFAGGQLILGAGTDIPANPWGGISNQTIDVEMGNQGTITHTVRGSINSSLIGGGTITFRMRTTSNRADFSGTNENFWGAFTGRVNFVADYTGGGSNTVADVRWGNTAPTVNMSLTNASVYLGTNVALDYSPNPGNVANSGGPAQVIGELSGAAGSFLLGSSIGTRAVLWRIGDLNTSSTFAGNICTNSVNFNGFGGVASVLKVGTGALTLLGTNNATGVGSQGTLSAYWVINVGSLILGHSYAADPLGTYYLNTDNGLIFSNDTQWTIGALASTGSIGGALSLMNAQGNPITLTIGTNGNSTTFSGNISGSGNIVKVGTGSLTLGGTNTFTGTMTIAAGTVAFDTNVAFSGASHVTVLPGASIGLFLSGPQPLLASSLGPANNLAIGFSSAAANSPINFQAALITNGIFVAATTMEYANTFTPWGNLFRLGANAGDVLYFTNTISDALYGAGTALEIDNYGGTVALIDSNKLVWTTNMFTGGTVVKSNTLYVGSPWSIGSGPLYLNTNTTLEVTNTYALPNSITIATNVTLSVDPSSWLDITNAIVGAGPLYVAGGGVLEIGVTNTFTPGTLIATIVTNAGPPVTYTTNNSVVGIDVTGGAVVFDTVNLMQNTQPLVLGAGGAVGLVSVIASQDWTTLTANINAYTTNQGGLAILPSNPNVYVDTVAAQTPQMALVAAQSLTYGGVYNPFGLRDGTGSRWMLGALANQTLTWTEVITNMDGPNILSIGGYGGGFAGTVYMPVANTFNAGAGSGYPDTSKGQVSINAYGVLYITNDTALGAPGTANGFGTTTDRIHGGLQFTNGQAASTGGNPPTLHVTNNITLNNRIVWFDGNGASLSYDINVDQYSSLIITNTIRMSFTSTGIGTLSKDGAGMLWLNAYNGSGTLGPNSASSRVDVNLNSGILRAGMGVGIPTNSIINLALNGSGDSVLEVTSGYYTNRDSSNPMGTRLRGTRPEGFSAYGVPLTVNFDTELNTTGDWVVTKSPTGVNVTNFQWQSGNGSFAANPLILNYWTANQNLTFVNNIDLMGGTGSSFWHTGLRGISVQATNGLTTLLPGRWQNTIYTNPVGIIKLGQGTLAMSGSNDYNGATEVSEGTLKLVGAGSITNSMMIIVGEYTNTVTNAIFDVSGTTLGGITIGASSNQWLAGGGNGTYTIWPTNAGVWTTNTIPIQPGEIVGNVTFGPFGSLAPGDSYTTTNQVYGIVTNKEWDAHGQTNVNIILFNTATNAWPSLTARTGTLIFSNNLTTASTPMYFDIGTNDAPDSGNSDLINVFGNLTLNGTLNVRPAPGFGLSTTYTIMTYPVASNFTYSPLTVVGPTNAQYAGLTYTVSTNTAGEVQLLINGETCPVASFGWTNASSTIVTFTDTSTGVITNWDWAFGDGATATLMSGSTSHTYPSNGTYSATLTVYGVANGSGCNSVATSNVVVTLAAVTDPFTAWAQHYYPGGGPAAAGSALTASGAMSNTNAWMAGFNPINPAAYLHIISVTQSSGNAVISYLGASGDNTYQPGVACATNVIEVSTGAGNNYTNNFVSTGVTNILCGGSGLGQVVTNTVTGGATNPTTFYRIHVLP